MQDLKMFSKKNLKKEFIKICAVQVLNGIYVVYADQIRFDEITGNQSPKKVFWR